MTILEKLKNEIENLEYLLTLKREGKIDLDLKFEVAFIDSNKNSFGDITTNLILILAQKIEQNPTDIAEVIVKEIQLKIQKPSELEKMIQRVEFAKNGFLNFFLREASLIFELNKVSQLENIETKFSGEKILVEHSSPNLFKPFHIGHLMNNIIGEAITQMLKVTKSEVKVVSFLSDISLGIAKAIYILEHKKNWSFFNQDIVKTLGEAYVEGVKFYEANPSQQEAIKNIANNLFNKITESEDYQLYEKAREVNLEYFKNILESLGTKLDKIIYESEAGVAGEKLVKANLNEEIPEEVFKIGEQGAIVYDTKRKKNNQSDETIKSVFINSEGHPTYEAKDLGLLELKYDYFPFEESIFITDAEQVPHFEVVLAAAKELGGSLKEIALKSIHIPHGRLNLSGERMSSRLGNILGVEELLNKLNTKVELRLGEKVKDLTKEAKEELVKRISLAALKIAILKSKPGLNINFDFETSLNFEGATGPYLLYTYARANSLFEKAHLVKTDLEKTELEINQNNRALVISLIQMENTLKVALENLAPQTIVRYLFELAQAFNTFYSATKILEENQVKTIENLALVARFSKIFKFTLNSLGIQEVEKM